jgi:hypothetical protein
MLICFFYDYQIPGRGFLIKPHHEGSSEAKYSKALRSVAAKQRNAAFSPRFAAPPREPLFILKPFNPGIAK